MGPRGTELRVAASESGSLGKFWDQIALERGYGPYTLFIGI